MLFRSKRVNNIAVFIFHSGIGISFFGPALSPMTDANAQPQSAAIKEGLKRILGEDATRSDYALRNAVLEATPQKLKPWIPRIRAIQLATLLSIKGSVESIHGQTGIFRIAANDWKGFQFDDPAKSPKGVQVDLYDPRDRHIVMVFKSKEGAQTQVTQADINLAIETLRASEENRPD